MTRRDCQNIHRRDFLTLGSAGLLGLTLADMLRLEGSSDRPQATTPARARNVIFIWLAGGPATIDIWDLKPNAPTQIRGEFRPIDTSAPGVQISEHLPLTARLMHHCTLVRSLAHGNDDHGSATVHMNAGNRAVPAVQYPAMGSLAARLLPATPGVPPYIRCGGENNAGNAGYLGTTYNPFSVTPQAQSRPNNNAVRTTNPNGPYIPGVSLPPGFTLEQLSDRDNLRTIFDNTFRPLDEAGNIVNGMDTFHRQAIDILRANRTRHALDLSQEQESTRQRYGTNTLGNAALTARRLIEAGARFVTLGSGGWDTHGGNFRALRTNLLPPLDKVLSALIEDLDRVGLLRSTLIYCAGEFGRTPRVNGGAGRDHWGRSLAVFLAGGGFRGGYAHGSTDANGMAPNHLPCRPDDVSATIFHALGFEPNYELISPSGRPLNIFPNGRVLRELLA